MNASYATVILFEMAHLWAQVQNLPAVEVERSSEKDRFDRMAREFPAMAQAAKLMQAAGFDYVNGLPGFDALSGDLQLNADQLGVLIMKVAPGIVRNGERIAAADAWTEDDSAALKGRFKTHFEAHGYPNSIGVMGDPVLQGLADEHPNEWAEACQEWEAKQEEA